MAARRAVFAIVIFVGMFAPAARAQTLLRWKLAAGQSFTVETRQHTESQVAFSGKTANTTIDLDMQLGWTVTDASGDKITLKQRIERASAKLTTPQGASVLFDSAASARPTGQARQLADALQPLIGAEVEITITGRGELQAAKPLNEAAQKIFHSGQQQLAAGDQQPGGKAASTEKPVEEKADEGGLSRSSLQQLLRQSFIVFPEQEVKPGDEWKSTSELTTAAGPMTQTTTYKLEDTTDRSGENVAKIATSSQLQPRPSAPAGKTNDRLRIKSQEQAGQILFSISGGCLINATLNQKLVTERPYRDVTIVVTLTSQQTTTVKAAK